MSFVRRPRNMLTVTEGLTLVIAVAACATVYWQKRGVELEQKKLLSEVNSLKEIVEKIDKEKTERRDDVSRLDEEDSKLYEDFSNLRYHGGLSTRSNAILNAEEHNRLAVCVSGLCTYLYKRADLSEDEELEKRRLDALAEVAETIGKISAVRSRFLSDLQKMHDSLKKGESYEPAKSIGEKYHKELKEAFKNYQDAWEKYSACLLEITKESGSA